MKKPYREGDQEVGDEGIDKTPITGFVAYLTHDGKVDVVTNIGGFSRQRDASMADIRDIAHSVFKDADNRIIAGEVEARISQGIAKALTIQSGKDRVREGTTKLGRGEG